MAQKTGVTSTTSLGKIVQLIRRQMLYIYAVFYCLCCKRHLKVSKKVIYFKCSKKFLKEILLLFGQINGDGDDML